MSLSMLFGDDNGDLAAAEEDSFQWKPSQKGVLATAKNDAKQDLADLAGVPAPQMRREMSLSKNALSTLEARLHELQKEEITITEGVNKNILKLQADIDKERLRLNEAKTRLGGEMQAIRNAIEKSKAARQQQVKAGTAEAKDEESACGVCLERPRDSLVAPCGHIAMCHACATSIHKSRNPECPFCRARIIAVYKTYHV